MVVLRSWKMSYPAGRVRRFGPNLDRDSNARTNLLVMEYRSGDLRTERLPAAARIAVARIGGAAENLTLHGGCTRDEAVAAIEADLASFDEAMRRLVLAHAAHRYVHGDHQYQSDVESLRCGLRRTGPGGNTPSRGMHGSDGYSTLTVRPRRRLPRAPWTDAADLPRR
jgi:hypothetical protein